MRRAGLAARPRPGAAAHGPPLPGLDWAYFLDIDGTLVDIAATPSAVAVDPDLRDVIANFYRATGGALALISGRAIADIDRLFPEVRIPVAGQHGAERRDASGRVSGHGYPPHRLDEVARRLAEAVARHPGLLLENKGLSLALHYRQAPRLAGYAHHLLRSAQRDVGEDYCVLAGHRVVEMKPAGRDKGDAVLAFMRTEPFHGRMPVFVGDDVTDEHGFEVVNRMHGHSIRVGPGRTVARWRLPGVRDVRIWLQQGQPTPAHDAVRPAGSS